MFVKKLTIIKIFSAQPVESLFDGRRKAKLILLKLRKGLLPENYRSW